MPNIAMPGKRRYFRKEHGYIRHGMSRTPECDTWKQIVQRCTNPNNRSYPNYGGRGIEIIGPWRDSFELFYAALGPRPSPKHSIDRINNDGNYEPGNVRWATASEQRRNQARRKLGFMPIPGFVELG